MTFKIYYASKTTNLMRQIIFLVTLIGISAFLPVMAKTYFYNAVCEHSYSKQGEQDEDLTKQNGRSIKCDSVILSFPDNGHVLIQITDKGSHLTPLGFGGIEQDFEANPNFVTVPLERIYLPHSNNPSTPQVVDGIEGFCFLDGKLNIRALASLSCSGKIEIGTQKLVYNIQVRITSLGESVPGM